VLLVPCRVQLDPVPPQRPLCFLSEHLGLSHERRLDVLLVVCLLIVRLVACCADIEIVVHKLFWVGLDRGSRRR
jgi:hypothetical protein